MEISTHFDPAAWEQNPPSLWTSPSSPPYREPESRNPFASPSQRASADQSLPSTPSEFEFDSLAALDVRDDPPVSPKFISSFATGYWAAASSSLEIGTLTKISSLRPDAVPSIDRPHDEPTTNTSATLSHRRKPPSVHPSPSVRQLITEEMRGGEHDEESDLDFYSAPQTPAPCSRPPTPKHRPFRLDYEQQLEHGSPSNMAQRKSGSTVLDRHDSTVLCPGLATSCLTPSKSETHARFIASASLMSAWDKGEEEKPGRKAGTSKSFKKWPFKDFLRRTVPNSKTDAHFMTKTLEATSSSRSFLSNPRSTPISPQASPLKSHMEPRPSTLQVVRPSSGAPRSPSHCPPFAHSRSPDAHSLDTHSEVCSPRQSSRTPAPSPPRSPLSPHLAHYKLQKAQSQELGRKTFLPYRPSLLGCLGGSGAFSSDQLVW